MVGHIKAGKLRPLAVTGAKRSPQLPDVPTVMESGVPGYEAYVWLGLLAPKGTPQPIIDKLHREVVAVLATAEVKTYMANAGIEIVGSTPAEFGTFFRAEKDLWAKVSAKPARRSTDRTATERHGDDRPARASPASSTGRRKGDVRLFLWEKFVGTPDGKPAVLFVHGSSMASQPTFDLDGARARPTRR